MTQAVRIPECTPEKKSEFQHVLKEQRKWQWILAALESREDTYPSPRDFEDHRRTVNEVIEELKGMAAEILKRK